MFVIGHEFKDFIDYRQLYQRSQDNNSMTVYVKECLASDGSLTIDITILYLSVHDQH